MASPFCPQSDLVEARGVLRRMVDTVLGALASGVLPSAAERQQVDLKEEAGRRGAGGVLLSG
jgi:ATP-dependent DNA helicase RecG